MFNTKFILKDGCEVYPGYLDKEQRLALRERYGSSREYMRCGCRPGDGLYYRLSEDLKIYPEHNNYRHDRYCSRYKNDTGETERQTAYVISDEDGEVTAYVTFNPKEFNLKKEIEKEQNNDVPEDDLEENENEVIVEKREKTVKNEEKNEPKLSLAGLIRSINVDSFTEKVVNNRKIHSKETFSKYVYCRMKKVRISRMQKPIGELSLEKDGLRFVYLPFAGMIKKKEKGLAKYYIQTLGAEGKVYNNFIFGETFEKAIKDYRETYGMEPDENTMVSGFQYYRKGHAKTMYRVLGRIHLFQTSELGLYCRSMIEKEAFDAIHKIVQADSNIKFWIPPEDESIGGIIQIKGMEKQILLLFPTEKDERVVFDSSLYEPLVVDGTECITKEMLYECMEHASY